ncbi:MAG: flippase-like domain-containing protein [Phycisphaerales bacterium]|nr:flippase-like domain-containing protein [Phycisphaerales bacterium]
MNKRVVFWVKVVVVVTLLAAVGKKVWDSWGQVEKEHIAVNGWWGAVAVAGFCFNMLIGSLVWKWLATKMGGSEKRASGIRMVGAYTFSQMGKYFPGKVALLLMRIERAGRFGISTRTTTLSTLLENALYMISGGLAGIVAVVKVAGHLEGNLKWLVWAATLGAISVLALGCYPPIFYGLVNRLLSKVKKEEIGRGEWLKESTLVGGVIGFLPCWIFGGLAMWATMRALHPVSLVDNWWLAGAFALSVIIGMASFLPGGAGVREVVLGVAAAMQFEAAGVGHANAIIMATVAAGLQRLFQIAAELIMGAFGALVTRKRKAEKFHEEHR